MTDKICLLREKLHSLLDIKPPIDDEVVRLSQELDKLIVEYNHQIKNYTIIMPIIDEDSWFFWYVGI